MFARLSARIVALTACCSPPTPRRRAPAALQSSLHEAGGRPDLLYVVLFSLPDCPYCVAVRQAYLPALPDDPRFGERVRIREVGIGSTKQLVDFDGQKASHADVARRLKVKFAPTVLFLDAGGQPRAEPCWAATAWAFTAATWRSASCRPSRRRAAPEAGPSRRIGQNL
jgi:glutaredoxin